MILLTTPIEQLTGVGERGGKILKKLGIQTVRDLIFYFPSRYQDFSSCVPIASVLPGTLSTIQGKVLLIANRRSKRKRMIITEGLIEDESGQIKVIWFNQSFLIKNIHVGDTICLSGKAGDSFFDLQLVNPLYEKALPNKNFLHTGRIVPFYSLGTTYSQKQFRSLMRYALDTLPLFSEWLPGNIVQEEGLLDFDEAIHSIHFPKSQEDFIKAQKRLSFDELLMYQLRICFSQKELQNSQAVKISFLKNEMLAFISSLPFSLTKDQKKCAWELMQDLNRNIPMNRLLQGDVGSGKTIVAGLAAFNVCKNGYQIAYMAPTEILARQHFETFSKWFEKFNISVVLITSSEIQVSSFRFQVSDKGISKSKTKKILYDAIYKGDVKMIIGTHALLAEKLTFKNLALVIIDEQHRFGVEQRKVLRQKSENNTMPHLLSLTATPIPRTLCLTLYGDLEISLLTQSPSGRKKIITKVVPPDFRDWTYDFIRKQIGMGRQAFVVCPAIDPSDSIHVKSVTEEYEKLSKDVFKNFRIGMLHGALKQKNKEKIIESFARQVLDILVTTSVIEVGIDMPNTTIMIIEGAERFGLAQLHQFRGRVGRSHHQSYCFLFPSSKLHQDQARLSVLAQNDDGRILAEQDLKLRGHGDLLGSQQSGFIDFKIASLSDIELLKKTRTWAKKIIGEIEQYPAIKKRLEEGVQEIHPE